MMHDDNAKMEKLERMKARRRRKVKDQAWRDQDKEERYGRLEKRVEEEEGSKPEVGRVLATAGAPRPGRRAGLPAAVAARCLRRLRGRRRGRRGRRSRRRGRR